MNDREAIKRLDNCAASPYMMAAIDLAISALQERVRNGARGCEFCGAKLYFKTTQYARPLLAPLTEVQALRDKLVDLTGEVYVEINADFCPMCGRPLKGEDND